jgi:hypothetical protein
MAFWSLENLEQAWERRAASQQPSRLGRSIKRNGICTSPFWASGVLGVVGGYMSNRLCFSIFTKHRYEIICPCKAIDKYLADMTNIHALSRQRYMGRTGVHR